MRLFFAGALALSACGVASADFIREDVAGTFQITNVTPAAIDFALDGSIVAEIGGLGLLNVSGTGTHTFVITGPPDLLTASFEFEGASASDTISVDLEGLIHRIPGQPNASASGTWELVGSTGVYAGYLGEGDFSLSYYFTSAAGGNFTGVFQGNVIVPAPGAAVLLGAAGFAARRRRR